MLRRRRSLRGIAITLFLCALPLASSAQPAAAKKPITHDVYDSPQHPYTRALLDAVPTL